MVNKNEAQFSIKALRTNEGMTQEALAQKLEIDRRTVMNWENNKGPIKQLHLYALAYLFKVDSDSIRI